jgi:hypothetical protein
MRAVLHDALHVAGWSAFWVVLVFLLILLAAEWHALAPLIGL